MKLEFQIVAVLPLMDLQLIASSTPFFKTTHRYLLLRKLKDKPLFHRRGIRFFLLLNLKEV